MEKGSTVDGCLFCKIVSGEIPARIVWENNDLVAFDDINPQAPVHTLIVPRKHFTNLNDDIPPSDLAAIFGAVSEVARVKGVADSGYRVIVNNGTDATQTVGHLHIHVIGGRCMGHGMVTFAGE